MTETIEPNPYCGNNKGSETIEVTVTDTPTHQVTKYTVTPLNYQNIPVDLTTQAVTVEIPVNARAIDRAVFRDGNLELQTVASDVIAGTTYTLDFGPNAAGYTVAFYFCFSENGGCYGGCDVASAHFFVQVTPPTPTPALPEQEGPAE